MKKLSLMAIMALSLATGVQAIDNTPFFTKHKLEESKNIDNSDKNSNVYIGISRTTFSTSDIKVLSVQPAKEIVGEGGSEIDLRIGLASSRKSDKSEVAKIYLYAWSNPDRNSEVGFGGGGEYIATPFESIKGLQFLIGGQVGYGWQGVKGDTTRISTSANKLSYVTNTINMNPTDITYTEDSYAIRVDLTLGSTYQVTNNLSLDLAYVYQYSNYQVEYRTVERSSILNTITFGHDSHGLKVGLNYKF